MKHGTVRKAAFLLAAAAFFGTGVSLFAARAVVGSKGESGGEGDGKPAPKTIITGSQMNLLNKGDAVEFVGGVKVVRGNDMLSADKVLSEEKKGYVHAWGNVYLRRDIPEKNVRWEAWSQEGIYLTDASSATLWNKSSRVKLKRSVLSSDGPAPWRSSFLEMKAVRFTFFQSTDPQPSAAMGFPFVSTVSVAVTTETFGGMEAQGDVYVFSQEISTSAPARKTEIWSDEAFFEGRGWRGVFWNRDERGGAIPRARQEEGDAVRNLKGKTLTYYIDDRRLVVQGRVSAEIWAPQNSTGTIKKEGR